MAHPITADDLDTASTDQESEVNQVDLDDLLTAVQEEIEDFWSVHMAAIEHGDLEPISETDDALVFADHTGQFWQTQFDAIVDYPNLIGAEDERIPETILAAHHNAAYRLVDYNWATANPAVVGKPADFDSAQLFVEAVVNGLIARGLSPGQAWAYYGVVIRGTSRSEWAERCGYGDHSTVSEAVRKAKDKLTRRVD